jgi:hypothetical protein
MTSDPSMTTDLDDWHQVLACVTGDLVRGEQRVSTQEVFTKYLGVPMTDLACRRLKRVMRSLGWTGPRVMRWAGRTMHGYWRHPMVGLPELVQAEPVAHEPAAQMATGDGGTLAPKLERVTHLGLDKLEQILRMPTDRMEGNLLRAQTAAAGIAVNAQLRADETRLRQKTEGDTLDRLLRAIEAEKRRQAGMKRKESDMPGLVEEVHDEPTSEQGHGCDV